MLSELRRLMLSGGAPPGAQIAPGEIADAFGVSPIPVREALQTLVGEGLVVHRPHAGYRVCELSLAELREIYFVRGVLEQAALARAVELIRSEDLELARAQHQELLTAARFDDRTAFHATSRMFHRTLTAPCDMPRLMHMFEATWNLTDPFQVMRAVTADTRRRLNDDHAALLDAFAARDVDAVAQVARLHHGRLESAIVETAESLSVRHEE
ncbi:putative GntR family transcriptional regulator [Gordonia soli NBRC 108243]|uniref:Putative GntR family transcriptional regulator n=1 Tax=Gordonia soli NBRC 108243 TaxID=1223545 RepID=M0QGR7_9ACTN|nr:putative GntR family transcriptional regulator [Gordonia soli NBRC 108243]